MARYNQIPVIQGPNPSTDSKDRILRYRDVKYPLIQRAANDIYIFTGEGDRYDILAQQYYNDSSLYWIISSANYGTRQDSLLPPLGTQIRIPAPSRINEILSNYANLNS